MQHKRLLDFEPVSRLATYHYYDDVTDETIIEEVQDVAPFYERNKVLQNAGDRAMGMNDYFKAGVKQSWAHVAHFTAHDQMALREQGINIYLLKKCDWTRKKLFRLLNSSDGRHLRTGLGRL